MEWTKPLSVVLVVLVIFLVLGAVVELVRSTFTDPTMQGAAIVTFGLVAIAVLGMIVLGARNRRWIQNPDSYW